MISVIDTLLITLFILAFVSTCIIFYIGIIGFKQKLKEMRSETYSKWSTCEECEGLGTLRVEDFDTESTSYSDYDLECEECGGSGINN